MAHKASEDPRLEAITRIALLLPETTREVINHHGIFRVRKKAFAYFLFNHHGDGIVGLSCKALRGDNTILVAAHPERFYLPAYTARQGWVALRLDVGEIDWDEVRELIHGSYMLVAPKGLARLVDSTPAE